MDIEGLRKLAELSLCEDCYQKYIALIEPTIKRLLSKPFREWTIIESYVTQMVMKLERVFKEDGLIMIYVDEEKDDINKIRDKVNVTAFQKIKRWGFKRKMEYLQDSGVLQNSSYESLEKARNIRNKAIHDELYEFSSEDRALIHAAYNTTSQLYYATVYSSEKEEARALKRKKRRKEERKMNLLE